jgi:hypothetical protein
MANKSAGCKGCCSHKTKCVWCACGTLRGLHRNTNRVARVTRLSRRYPPHSLLRTAEAHAISPFCFARCGCTICFFTAIVSKAETKFLSEMTSFDSSRVIFAFDGLVEHMQTIELPPFDTFQVSETLLPAFKTVLQQYADQHNRTKKDIASLHSAWTCIASVAPYTLSQAVLESSGNAMLPPASSLPDDALDTVSNAASGSSEIENSHQLVHQLQQQLQDSTTQYEAQNEDVCTENERLRLQISESEARLLAPPPNPSASHAIFELQAQAKRDGGPQLGVQHGQPSTTQFARATFNAAQRKDEAFMRQIFNRNATNEKLSTSTLIAALKDVDAPLLATTSSESSSADFVFRRADSNMSGDIDFSE